MSTESQTPTTTPAASNSNTAPETKAETKVVPLATQVSKPAETSSTTTPVSKVAKKPLRKPTTKKKTAKKTASKTKTSKTRSKATNRKSISPKKEETMAKTNNTVNFEDYSKQAYEGLEQFTSFGKEFFDAWLQSSNIASAGAQQLLKESMTASQQATENALSTAKELMTCRSLNEFTEKQNAFAQETMNQSLNTATTFTEKYIKLCTDAAEPLNKKITSSVERATKAAGGRAA